MPVFLLGPVIATGARWVLGGLAAGAASEIVSRRSRAYFEEYGAKFLQAAAEDMGLEVSEGGAITDESITRVINQKLLANTGIQIESLLDRDRLIAGLERLAIEKLAAEFGIQTGGAKSIYAVRDQLQVWAVGQVSEQLRQQAGDVFAAATGAPVVQKIIDEAVKNEAWNTPTDFSAKGVDNRARQAKYRARHKKTWVQK